MQMSRIETGVMRVGGIRQASRSPAPAAGGEAAPAHESRALIVVSPPAQAAGGSTRYRQAPFLAHLLAVRDQHAQTRERRRAEPQDAIAAYRAAAGLVR